MFANGDTYTGEYKKGRPDGWGEYTWDNKATYVGEWKNGLKHGKGHWTKGD